MKEKDEREEIQEKRRWEEKTGAERMQKEKIEGKRAWEESIVAQLSRQKSKIFIMN